MAWKLAAVTSGSLKSAPTTNSEKSEEKETEEETRLRAALRAKRLLGSYDKERRPVAEANTRLSLTNYGKSERAAAALGVDPKVITAITRIVSYVFSSFEFLV